MGTVRESLEKSGFTVNEFVFTAGEESKTPETLIELWRHLASVPMTRSDMLIALGGGVTGDVTGFAAATYLRGVKYVQIPTSLLAMVDSSVGGKTAIDLPEGKNLCGAFCQPSLVICDVACLDTLPKKEYSCGMAEVIKYAMIDRPVIFELIEKDDTEALIYECIDDKREKVEADECDNGIRQLLNLGHTFGHAIEKLENFKMSHGEAVAVGMTLITRYAVAQGMCTQSELERLTAALKKYALPTETMLNANQIAGAAMGDKKRKGNSITLVLPLRVGKSRLHRISADDLLDFFAAGL
jgi:3-dehydroquinate synthase